MIKLIAALLVMAILLAVPTPDVPHVFPFSISMATFPAMISLVAVFAIMLVLFFLFGSDIAFIDWSARLI